MLFSFSSIGCAQWHHIGSWTSYERDRNQFTFHASPAVVQLTVLSDDIIRMRLAPTGKFDGDFSYALIKQDGGPVTVDTKDTDSSLEILTNTLRICVLKHPLRISFYDRQTSRLIHEDDHRKGMAWDHEEIKVWKRMPQEEHYYGFGEKTGSLEKRNIAMTNWNTDIPGYRASTDPLYQSIPFFMAINEGRTYGIFFDNTYRTTFDIGKESRDTYSFGADGGELNYYFVNGPAPKDVSKRLASLIGTMPLPPKWAIGYQQSRWSYYPDTTVRNLADNFRRRKIPCDVIYLDIHYMNGYRVFTWDTTRFPDPRRMISDLSHDGFHIVPIIDPGIKQDESYAVYLDGLKGDVFVRNMDDTRFIGSVWPGRCAFPDFTDPKARKWWGMQFKEMVSFGMTGFWNDMNEPSVFDGAGNTMTLTVKHDFDGHKKDHRAAHNVYGMQMARATFEGVKSLNPMIRPFVLTRAGYAGVQRYAAIWSGDNISSWEHLYQGSPTLLNLSISGQPFVGDDIGGFIGSPSGELFTRWLQKGVFHPFCRVHTEIDSKPQEPWSYGEKFEAINKRYIELRYELLPFLYSQFRNASVTGIPVMRPLVYNYPALNKFAYTEDEFMLGDDVLICPVIHEGATSRQVNIPPGRWYSFWNDQIIREGEWRTVSAPIDTIPFFIREGAIIPMQPVVQYTNEDIDKIILHVYPDSTGYARGELYEDEGEGYGYQKGNFRITGITASKKMKDLRLSYRIRDGQYIPKPRMAMAVFHVTAESPEKIILNGRTITPVSFRELHQTKISGWNYDRTNMILYVIWEDGGNTDLKISFK